MSSKHLKEKFMNHTIRIINASILMVLVILAVACNSANETIDVSYYSSAVAVSAGQHHTCAVVSGGSLKCWGNGISDQLGNGSTSSQSTPVSVSGISTATSVSAGDVHTCAVLSGGSLKCWGQAINGELGDGTTSKLEETPVSVSGFL